MFERSNENIVVGKDKMSHELPGRILKITTDQQRCDQFLIMTKDKRNRRQLHLLHKRMFYEIK